MPFSAEKLIKFVTTVVVKVDQPQLCYSNISKGAIEKKSNVCKQISEVAQQNLRSLHRRWNIISAGTAPTPTPFSFAPKEASAKPKTIAEKASTVLENITSSATKPSTTEGRFPPGGIFRAEWYFLLSLNPNSPPIGL